MAETATYIVLVGVQGSGKGTQAPKLASKYGVPHVSTGVLFRAMKTEDTPLAREIQSWMNAGKLVPDDLTIKMVRERLTQPDAAGGAILDGFPRTRPQAEALDALLVELQQAVTVVPYLVLDREIAIKRITDRWECSVNEDHKYNLTFNPPKVTGKCDIDGAPLKQRPDDTLDSATKRVNDFFALTMPMLDYYREKGLLQEINANQSIDQVTAELFAVVEAHK